MITFEVEFESALTRRIWDSYFGRVEKMVKQVPRDQREEILLELKSHVVESASRDLRANETERILNAIAELGEPEVFIKPLIAEKLIRGASTSFNPRSVAAGLYYNLFSGVKSVLFSSLFAVGYGIVILLLVSAVAKFVVPDFGLYWLEGDGITIGTLSEAVRGDAKELLGNWLAPLNVVTAAVVYFLITRVMGLMYVKKR